MKKPIIWFLMALLLTSVMLSISGVAVAPKEGGEPCIWAVLMCGADWPPCGHGDAQYMYHILTEHYNISKDHIYYSEVNASYPGVNATATKENFRWAIKNWTASRSDADDIVFIFSVSHGGGYHKDYGLGPFEFYTTRHTNVSYGRVSFGTNDENQDNETKEGHFILSEFSKLSDPPELKNYYDIDEDGQKDDVYCADL